MFNINVIWLTSGGNAFFQELYDSTKHAIPEILQKEYEYSGDGPLYLPLFKESNEYSYVWEEALKHEITPTIIEELIYTKDEEETFEFFSLSISTPLENQGNSLSDYGTKFEGGCPFCGRGKKLVGDAYINRNFVKKYDFASLEYGYVFLSNYVKTLIEENSFTGIKFPARLLDYKGRDIPEYYCPEFENILPPMSEKTWVYTDDFLKRYDICGHYPRLLRSSVKYTRTALKDAMDFNLSKECFNHTHGQEIIISKRVRDLFKKQKIRAWPLPVQIVD